MLDVLIQKFAQAIATAEGFFVAGSRPARNHNPGDLERDITGTGIGWDGPFVIYGSDSDGWDALNQQVNLMLTNGSSIYNSTMTLLDVASHYTLTNAQAWAQTVADQLGVTIDTTLDALINNFSNGSTATGGAVIVLLLVAFLALKKGPL